MKLVKLLSVGQSLKSGKTILGKYKLTQQSLLPKFAATFRPISADIFAAPADSAKVNHETVPPAAVSEEIKTVAPAASAVEPSVVPAKIAFDQTQKIAVGQILRRAEEVAPRPAEISLAVRIGSSLAHKISSLKSRLFPARSKRKPFATPVQTEWSLEKVTVVRNDLNEADLEVVSPKPKVTPVLQNHKPSLPDLGTVKNSGRRWIKKTTGLFKSNSPFEPAAESQPDVAPVEAEKQPDLAERI